MSEVDICFDCSHAKEHHITPLNESQQSCLLGNCQCDGFNPAPEGAVKIVQKSEPGFCINCGHKQRNHRHIAGEVGGDRRCRKIRCSCTRYRETREYIDHSFGPVVPDEHGNIYDPKGNVINDDPVNHPKHYGAYKGVEVIEVTRQLNFNRGNAVKYVARAGLKDKSKEIEDLKKAVWYLKDEIKNNISLEWKELNPALFKLIRQMNYNRGTAVEAISLAALQGNQFFELQRAVVCIEDEIAMLTEKIQEENKIALHYEQALSAMRGHKPDGFIYINPQA